LLRIRARTRLHKELVEKFRANGFEPEAYTLYSYSALQVIAEAAKTTGGNDPQAVAENIKGKGPFKTVIGEFGYDEKGDITRPDYVMYTWKKGDDGKFSYFENESGPRKARHCRAFLRFRPLDEKTCYRSRDDRSVAISALSRVRSSASSPLASRMHGGMVLACS
jgi:hypothetical protein